LVAAAPLTGSDRPPDLLVADAGPGWGPDGNTVAVLLNNGDGTFCPGPAVPVGNAPSGIAVGDFDGDNIADIAVANQHDNTVSVLLGNGDGSFRAGALLTTDLAPAAISTADFNGRPGLVVACSGSNAVDVFLGDGRGGFVSAGPSLAVGAGAYALVVLDLNADGHADVVTANPYDHTVSVLLGHGDGTFGPAQPFFAGI
jgi:hypothetical protein